MTSSSWQTHETPPPSTEAQVIKELESLVQAGQFQSETFREAAFRVFANNHPPAVSSRLQRIALASSVPEIRELARVAGFAGQVAEQGFDQALLEVEETLFESGDQDELVDFLAEHATSHDRLGTLEWLQDQGDLLWEEALPLIVTDWAAEEPTAARQWISSLTEGGFRDRAVTEFAATLANQQGGQSSELVASIADEDIRQEARIRTGELDFTILGKQEP